MRTLALLAAVAITQACGSSDSDAGAASGGSAGNTPDASLGGAGGGGSGSGGLAGASPDASSGGSSGGGGSSATGGSAGTAGSGGTSSGGAGGAASGGASSGGSGSGGSGSYVKGSLSGCWTDPSCPRVFAVAHGGAWALTGPPYDSNAALAAAYSLDADGVKIDVRVTKDNVPVISHSSPIEFYESLDCGGKTIEDMTAADVIKCHRFPSTTETFQRLDDVLGYLKGKMVVELTVKLAKDFARTISEIHAQGAEDFAFIELSTSELQNQIPTLPGSSTVYYVVNVASNLSEVDTLLGTIKNPRAILYEFDPPVDVSTLTPQKLHPAGVRSFTYTNAAAPSQAELQALFQKGYDVVSSQNTPACVAARKAVNQSRGVSPP